MINALEDVRSSTAQERQAFSALLLKRQLDSEHSLPVFVLDQRTGLECVCSVQ